MITAHPEVVGFSATRLRRIDQAMARWIDGGLLAGAITLVARHGRVAHLQAYGMAEIETNRPMQRDTIVRVYSMSKPITAVAALILYEEGLYQLDDPVAAYLPAFKDTPVSLRAETGWELVSQANPMTIRHLFTHTSGLMYPSEEDTPAARAYREAFTAHHDADLNLDEFAQVLASLPLAFQPGSGWQYGFSIDVLGCLIEVLSGMPFDVFLKERLFGPLGMVDTDFWVPPDKAHRLAALYSRDEAGALVAHNPTPFWYNRPTRNPSGGGGLVSTIGDYFRFAQMLLNRGELDGVRLLGRKTVEWMMMNHLPAGVHPHGDPAVGFGLGGSVLLDPGRATVMGSRGNFGWGGAANTNFWVDPQEELVGILMLQFMPSETYPVVADFRNLVYAALDGAASHQPSAVSK